MITTIIVAAAIAANAYITGKVVQEPTFDYKFAVPQSPSLDGQQETREPRETEHFVQSLGQATSPRLQIYSTGKSPSQLSVNDVFSADPAESTIQSVSFHGSKASEVLSWLERQGVSFIVDDSLVKSKTVTMNIVKKPLGSILDSISAALGGHWSRHGAIRVLEPGLRSDEFFSGTREYASTITPSQELKIVDPAAAYSLPKTVNQSEFVVGGNGGSFSINGNQVQVDQFIQSFSPEQRVTMKAKGFLSRSDLTAEQIKMLGLPAHENQVIILIDNGERVTIKNP